jgi:RNA polymerase sigma factor (sigma-70 family)
MVLRTLVRLLGSQEHIEDLAQEVFLRLHRAWPHFQGRAQVSTYLYRITVNVARDERRRQRHLVNRAVSLSDPQTDWESRLVRQDPAADTIASRKELWAIVTRALQELSDVERAVIVLYHQEERSYDEIARILDLPINTVRTHLHRGRERLGRLVRERCQRDV